MLVYEKTQKKPLKVVCPEETINLIQSQSEQMINRVSAITNTSAKQALSCDGTAISRDVVHEKEKEETVQARSPAAKDKMQQLNEESKAAAAEKIDVRMLSTESSVSQKLLDSKLTDDAEMISAPVSLPESRQSQSDESSEQTLSEFIAQLPHSFLIYPGLISRIYHDHKVLPKY